MLGRKIFTKQIRKYLPGYQCDMCDNEELMKEGSVLPAGRQRS